MRLYLKELRADGLSQAFTPYQNTEVRALRPHLYVKGSPSGGLKMQILDSSGLAVLAESETVPISLITAAHEFHGYVRFYVNASLMKDTEYVFKLVGVDGYTFGASNWVGLCREIGFEKYDRSGAISYPTQAPFDFEIWGN